MTDGKNLKPQLKILSSIFIILWLGCSNSTQLPAPEKKCFGSKSLSLRLTFEDIAFNMLERIDGRALICD